jgi:rare lipoprotein A
MLFLLSGCSLAPRRWGKHIEKGHASWYGNEYNGRRTASGEIYDERALTAAHRKLPFGTLVRGKSLDNDKSVIVRINDRGPFHRGRVIDLSKAAARELDMVRDGVVSVRLEVVKWGPRSR